MENTPHTQSFSTGKLVLKSPCSVGPAAFTPTGDRNKFCSQCNKVVHNLVGKSEAEIKALFAANGGEICGTMLSRKPAAQPQIRLVQPLRKANYFKHLAATASLLLLTQAPSFAASSAKAPITWITQDGNRPTDPTQPEKPSDKTNTLITGVVMNQDSVTLPYDFQVSVYANKVLVAKVKAHYGLFKVDLRGKVAPGDVVGLVIQSNSGTDPNNHEKIEHGATQRTLPLHEAQNVTLVMQYQFPYDNMVDGGLGWIDEPELDPTADASDDNP